MTADVGDCPPGGRKKWSSTDYRAVREALALSGLPPLQRLVVHTLLEHVHKPLCMPSIARLAGETGCPERSLKRHIASLERAGWLVVERQRGALNVYWITIPTGANRGQPGPELGPGATLASGPRPGPKPGPTEAKTGASPGQALAPYVRDVRDVRRESDRARAIGATLARPLSERTQAPRPIRGFAPDWRPNAAHHVRATELGLTAADVEAEAEDCLRKAYPRGIKSEDDQFFRELTWLARDKEAERARARGAPTAPRKAQLHQPNCGLTGFEIFDEPPAKESVTR